MYSHKFLFLYKRKYGYRVDLSPEITYWRSTESPHPKKSFKMKKIANFDTWLGAPFFEQKLSTGSWPFNELIIQYFKIFSAIIPTR